MKRSDQPIYKLYSNQIIIAFQKKKTNQVKTKKQDRWNNSEVERNFQLQIYVKMAGSLLIKIIFEVRSSQLKFSLKETQIRKKILGKVSFLKFII